MKKLLYILPFFLFFACNKKQVVKKLDDTALGLETKAAFTPFSKFENDYYFWQELRDLENAAVSLVDIKDANGKLLSGRYQVTYGIYDGELLDAIIPNTSRTENISFYNGTAIIALDLADLLKTGSLQNTKFLSPHHSACGFLCFQIGQFLFP